MNLAMKELFPGFIQTERAKHQMLLDFWDMWRDEYGEECLQRGIEYLRKYDGHSGNGVYFGNASGMGVFGKNLNGKGVLFYDNGDIFIGQ